MMNFTGASMSGENFDESDTIQVYLPENLLNGRNNSARKAGDIKIGGKVDQSTLTMQIGDVVVKNKGSEYVFSSANGMLIDPDQKLQFYGISLGKAIPGINMPITNQIRGIAHIMNHSDVLIKPGDLLTLKIPSETTKKTIDGRVLFHLVPYDESDYIRSITKNSLINILKDEQKFQNLYNMRTRLDQEQSIAIKSFKSILASFVPILSFLDEIGLITFNLNKINIVNFIGQINGTNIDRISGQQSFNSLNNGNLAPRLAGVGANNTRSKTDVRDHIETISQLFNIDGRNNVNDYSAKFLQMLMMRFFSEDKNIANIGGKKDVKLSTINDNIQSLRESELTIKSDMLRRKVVAKATTRAQPGQSLKITF